MGVHVSIDVRRHLAGEYIQLQWDVQKSELHLLFASKTVVRIGRVSSTMRGGRQ
jgi:hypothetical protein